MSNFKKLMMSAATGGGGLNVEDVFSTYLYTGNGSSQTITNGIDLDGEGGLVWVKMRSLTRDNTLVDTERGVRRNLKSNTTAAEGSVSGDNVNAFYSNGFLVGPDGSVNTSSGDYASWTFRKAPKFFDVVTYTGNNTAGKTVSHNLGSVPGCIIVKRTDNPDNWYVYHRGLNVDGDNAPETDYIRLNLTSQAFDSVVAWNDTAPTSTEFTLGDNDIVNATGGTYVAYLFAHNDGDGEFGPDGDADIIKCGSYTGNGSSQDIDLGFEPQWVLFKNSSYNDSFNISHWSIYDNMRGVIVGGDDTHLRANTSDPDQTQNDELKFTATGFSPQLGIRTLNASGDKYIYIAIRRGTKVPESGTEVFNTDANGGTSSGNTGALTSGFPVDLAIFTQTTGANKEVISRINSTRLFTNLTNAENTPSRVNDLDFMNGFGNGTYASDYVGWMWKRAPGFFDVVAYTGGSPNNKQIPHNLGVVPELIIQKQRSGVSNWHVWCGLAGQDYSGRLNLANPFDDQTGPYYFGSHTDTYFSVGYTGYETNVSGSSNIAYLFASLPGISKVGSFSHTFGGTTNVDCGFTSGARFVLWKRTDGTRHWEVFDTTRGIVAGNDAYLRLSDTIAETSGDYIDPYSAGFSIGSALGTGEYIFYAIA